jgi:hypothetical protein
LLIGLPQLPFKVIELVSSKLTAFTNNPFVEKMLFYSETNLEHVSENVNPAIQTFLAIAKRTVFLVFYLIVIRNNKYKLDPLTDYFFNIYVVGFSFYVLLNGSPIFQVLTTYFTFIEIALIGRVWAYAQKNAKLSFLVVLFIYGFLQLLSSLNSYPDLYMHYKSFLSNK